MTDAVHTPPPARAAGADRAAPRAGRAATASRAHAPRPHPLRSLVVSAGAHALLVAASMLIPVPYDRPVGTDSRAATWRRISVTVALPSSPVTWPEPDEPAREVELAALAPAEELLEETDVEAPELPTRPWFGEDAPPPPARRAAEPARADALAAVPEDLFRAPEPPEPAAEPPEEAPPEEAEATEPTEEERAEEAPPIPEEPTEEELPPDDVDSDPAPEREGEAEEAEQSGDGDARSALVSAPAPRYPPMSQARGDEGTVVLDIRVDADGEVIEVRVLESSGHALLDEAARSCVEERWRFLPAREDEPRLRRFREPVTFRIVG